MQKRGRSEKRRLLFDGVEFPGLVRCGGLSPEEGELEVAELQRLYTVGDGTIKWPPLEGAFLDTDANGIEAFFRAWKLQHQTKEVTYIRVDGHGDDVQRVILPDTECLKMKHTDADHGGVVVAMVEFKLAFFEPIFL